MPIFEPRFCNICNNPYTPTGPAARFCPNCAQERRKSSAVNRARSYRQRLGRMVGVGSGGANAAGAEDSQYGTGIAWFMKNRRRLKEERRFCNRCTVDLANATRYQWCMHHIDHDRSHNSEENLELLCKRCHQLEHDCHLALKA